MTISKNRANISGKTLGIRAIKTKVQNEVEMSGGFREAETWFEELGYTFSASYLRSIVNGPALPSKKLCEAIGFEPIKEIKYRYREIK